jgi:hypothetical protein
VARGGSLRLGVRPSTTAHTEPHMSVPSAVAAMRAPAAPPVMDRRGLATPAATVASNPGRAMTAPPGTPAPAASRDMESAAGPDTPPPPEFDRPAAAVRATVRRRSWGGIAVFIGALVLAGIGWWQRVPISQWLDRNAPNRSQWLGWWSGFESWAAAEIAPLLNRIGLHVSPVIVIDVLAGLVVLLLLRNLYASTVRARNRRAYLRAQERKAA